MKNINANTDAVICNSPIVLHIPHSSRRIPNDIRSSILLSDDDLEKELIKMTDAYTDELFISDLIDAQNIVFPLSRLVLDPERFLDDNQEIMAERGMGVIYTLTANGLPLRLPMSVEERKILIDKYYQPHHKKLQGYVKACLKKFERCIIIDCHSFPSIALPYEFDQSENRPDICIGMDDFHSPNWLVNNLCNEFEKFGYSTAVNMPFSGTIIPMRYYLKEPSVLSIMIEVNRKLYMDEISGRKNSGFNVLKGHITKILNKILISFK